MSRAVFLDRDGVINQRPPEGEYITRWEDFHILPGVAEGIALLNHAGFSVIVVTNQRCVAKGLMTESDLQQMHERMTDFLARAGADDCRNVLLPARNRAALRLPETRPGHAAHCGSLARD